MKGIELGECWGNQNPRERPGKEKVVPWERFSSGRGLSYARPSVSTALYESCFGGGGFLGGKKVGTKV